jgi:tetratricopeptide (TPR) repeat protein
MAGQLRVFVSHASEDSAFCYTIVAALREAGADVWYDEHNMGSGRLADEILRELGRRPIFVVILSKHAFASRWVKRETDWAEELKERDPSRAILPVTAGAIERDDFGTENGWLAYYSYKRVEAPGFAPFAPDEAARRLLHALGLTPAGEAPAPIAPQPTENADDLLTRAKALIAQDKYAEALPLLERATHLAPGSFDAWATLGYILGEQGRYQESLVVFDRALALDDKQAWVWNNKSKALINLKHYEEALTCCDRALALDPKYEIAWSNKGVALRNLGRYHGALSAFDRALALNPNKASVWNNKGNALRNLKQYKEAMAAVDRSLALKPDLLAAWATKGEILSAMRQYNDALLCFDRAILLVSNIAEIWNYKAGALRGLGRTAEAAAAEQRAKALGWTE